MDRAIYANADAYAYANSYTDAHSNTGPGPRFPEDHQGLRRQFGVPLRLEVQHLH